MLVAILSAALFTAGDSDTALEPWASKAQPGDVTKSHVENISIGEHKYTVMHGGMMDGTNCRSPMGCGMNREGAIEQTWQSNRAVRLENVGQTDIVNPWLSNGRNNFRDIKEIVASAVTPGMNDGEKARALWFQQIQLRFHCSGGEDLGDPVKVFNVYGHNPCGKDAMMMGGLWKQVGLQAAPVRLVGHAIAQVRYDGDWHVMDGDLDMIYLLRDNETLANDRQLAHDHDLVKRTHTMGILVDDSRKRDEQAAAMFVSEEPIKGSRACKEDTTMTMTLRPGEALVWRWGHMKPAKTMWPNALVYPDSICNGLWEYRPDFRAETWRKGAMKVENIAPGPDGLAAENSTTGTVVWNIASPYPFVGGHLETEASGAKFAVSPDGEQWTDIAGGNFDKFFPLQSNPYYQYQLRCELPAGAKLKRLAVINDLQMALLALPEMMVGENSFTYTDKSSGERKVRITHEWVERSTSKPPESPKAVYPPDGGQAEGTDFAFRWSPPKDPDGDTIADYHFMLANRQDMRWPLSTNFDKLISRTADKSQAQYSLPSAGLLTGGKTYYWRVRAKDAKGVWGPWSKTFSFMPQAPNYPLEVALGYDKAQGIGALTWKANPVGQKPVKYRVYGSNEKGFSVSDVPYRVNVGLSKELQPEFPANFIAETTATELAVLSDGVESPNANQTYYRVVAVDAQGKRSGPSNYATAPRPTIYGKLATRAKVGTDYRSQLQANRSQGDLRLRIVNGKETANFWDIEQPKFAIAQGPAWLKIDPATGLLSGTPVAAGKIDVAVTVTIDREVRKLDDGTLGWGIEKVVSTSTERVGSATRMFSIEVDR